MIRRQRKKGLFKIIGLMGMLSFVTSCQLPGPPNTRPQKANFVSLDPHNWIILYSSGMPQNPSADLAGAWSFHFPSYEAGGHVNYVQTPFNKTTTLRNVTITFTVESDDPRYHVMDDKDHLPATFHVFMERQNDNLEAEGGRFWAQPSKYNLGSDDNHQITITVPLTSDCWTDVDGKNNSDSFQDLLKNIGWIGITFGGQFFFGHGVALAGGSAKFVLVDFFVN